MKCPDVIECPEKCKKILSSCTDKAEILVANAQFQIGLFLSKQAILHNRVKIYFKTKQLLSNF